MKKILVVGSFMTDLVAKAPRVPMEGETIIGDSFNVFTGGKGANQAVSAARLGGKVSMIGKLGMDNFASLHIDSMKKENIDYSAVLYDDKTSTGVGSITLEENGNNRIIIIPGANLKLTPEEIIRFENIIKENDIIILQLEIPLETVYKTIELARKNKKIIIFNPAPATNLNYEFIKMVDYIVPNETEAYLLTGIEVKTIEDAEEAAKKLLKTGCKNVIITLGAKGVLLVNEDENIFVDAFKVKAVDTTAAGDSFIGGFAYSLALEKEHREALRFSNAVAALTVTKMGAQPSLPKINEVEEFFISNCK